MNCRMCGRSILSATNAYDMCDECKQYYQSTAKFGNLRDYFAGFAMQGILSSSHGWMLDEENEADTPGTVSKLAYKMADEMIKERDK